MWRVLLIALTLAGCAQLPPSPQDAQAKKFETVPDKAVIYLVRQTPDFNRIQSTLMLDDTLSVTTFTGTYYRWEVAPGTHHIAGFAGDGSVTRVHAEAGKIYFVQQTLLPGAESPISSLQLVDERYGRALVMSSQIIPTR